MRSRPCSSKSIQCMIVPTILAIINLVKGTLDPYSFVRSFLPFDDLTTTSNNVQFIYTASNYQDSFTSNPSDQVEFEFLDQSTDGFTLLTNQTFKIDMSLLLTNQTNVTLNGSLNGDQEQVPIVVQIWGDVNESVAHRNDIEYVTSQTNVFVGTDQFYSFTDKFNIQKKITVSKSDQKYEPVPELTFESLVKYRIDTTAPLIFSFYIYSIESQFLGNQNGTLSSSLVNYGFSERIEINVTCGAETLSVSDFANFHEGKLVFSKVQDEHDAHILQNFKNEFSSNIQNCPHTRFELFWDQNLQYSFWIDRISLQQIPNNPQSPQDLKIQLSQPLQNSFFLNGRTLGEKGASFQLHVTVCGFESFQENELEFSNQVKVTSEMLVDQFSRTDDFMKYVDNGLDNITSFINPYQKYTNVAGDEVESFSLCSESIENREIGLKRGQKCEINVSNFLVYNTGFQSDEECLWTMWLDIFQENCQTPYNNSQFVRLAAIDNGKKAKLVVNRNSAYEKQTLCLKVQSRGFVQAQTIFIYEVCGKERVQYILEAGQTIDFVYRQNTGDQNFQHLISIDQISQYFEVLDSKGIENPRCPIERYELVKWYQNSRRKWVEEPSTHEFFSMDEFFNLNINTDSEGFRSKDLHIKAYSRGDQFVYMPITVEVCGTETLAPSDKQDEIFKIELDKILGQNATLEVQKYYLERRFSLERTVCGIRKFEIVEDEVKSFIGIDSKNSSLMINRVKEVEDVKANIIPFHIRAFATGNEFAESKFELTILKYNLPPDFVQGDERSNTFEIDMIRLTDEELERQPVVTFKTPLIFDNENDLILEPEIKIPSIPCSCITTSFYYDRQKGSYIQIDVDRQKISEKDSGTHKIEITLKDDGGYPELERTVEFNLKIFSFMIETFIKEENSKNQEVKQVQTVPVKLTVEQMNSNGLITINFNQKLQVSDSVDQRLLKYSSQQLVQAIKSTDEKLNETLSLLYTDNSALDEDGQQQVQIQFTYSLVEWTESRIQILVEFQDPLLVSRGQVQDTIQVLILKPENFRSQEFDEILIINDQQMRELTISVPAMLPADIDEQELEDLFTTATQISYLYVGLQILIQAVIKGSMKHILGTFLCFQQIQALTLYSIKMPVLQIFTLSKIRELVNFEMLKPIPAKLLKFILGEESYNQTFVKKDEDIDPVLERSGVKSSSFVSNLQLFVTLFVYFVLFLIAISPFLIWKKTRDLIIAKAKGFKKKFIWNGFLSMMQASYIKYCTALGAFIYINMLEKESKGSDLFVNILKILPFSCLVILYPLISYRILMKNANEYLREDKTIESFGNLYSQIDISKDTQESQIKKLYYPMILLQKFIFIMIPVFARLYPWFQIQLLMCLQLTYMMSVFHINPHDGTKIERVIDNVILWFTHILYMHLTCQCDFVQDLQVRFKTSYSVIANLVIILMLNLSHILLTNQKYLVLVKVKVLRQIKKLKYRTGIIKTFDKCIQTDELMLSFSAGSICVSDLEEVEEVPKPEESKKEEKIRQIQKVIKPPKKLTMEKVNESILKSTQRELKIINKKRDRSASKKQVKKQWNSSSNSLIDQKVVKSTFERALERLQDRCGKPEPKNKVKKLSYMGQKIALKQNDKPQALRKSKKYMNLKMSQINEGQEISEVLSSQNAIFDEESRWGQQNDLEKLAQKNEELRLKRLDNVMGMAEQMAKMVPKPDFKQKSFGQAKGKSKVKSQSKKKILKKPQ